MRQVGAIRGSGLLQDLPDVELNRVLAQVDLRGDLAVGETLDDQAHDLDLEPAEREWRCPRTTREGSELGFSQAGLPRGAVDGGSFRPSPGHAGRKTPPGLDPGKAVGYVLVGQP